MPRKTKEQTEIEKEENTRKPTKKPTTTSKKTTTKKATGKTASKKVPAKKKADVKTKATKTSTIKSKTAKTSAAKKTSAKKTATKRSTSRKKTTTKKPETVEYYDLPYRYNQTVVKVLAQTPNTLFIYWDISDTDRKAFEDQYGENFFETTRPVLIVRNDTLGYSFEVEINDFANSWYLHINDSKCDYKIELGRRPITKTEKINVDYIYISSSNEIETPNDKVLFNKEQKMVYFRNIKTGVQTSKEVATASFIRNMGKIYDIYDIDINNFNNANVNILSTPSSGSLYQ